MNRETPISLTANKSAAELTIYWQDGHVSVYPFALLRAACPCASCRGGHENMRPVRLPESVATRLAKIEAVGQYAITIEWEDGHHYGIYNWHYLRELCPCEACRADAARSETA
jgi:DUF971 family protein